MKKLKIMLLTLVLAATPALAGKALLDQDYRRLAGKERVNLGTAYQGQVLLVVNTASKCGNTPQYEALEAMYSRYKDRGFAVLGFPSNDSWGRSRAASSRSRSSAGSPTG